MTRPWWRGLRGISMLYNGGTSTASAPVGESTAQPPLPAHFIPGEVFSAWQTTEVPYAGTPRRRSPAQRAGLAYQRRIGDSLRRFAGAGAVSSPWFIYSIGTGGRRYCQPDFLVARPAQPLLVVEVKLRWTTDAWWQLKSLYLPVVRLARPSEAPIGLCITRSYDPAVRIPDKVNLLFSMDEPLATDAFNILVLR